MLPVATQVCLVRCPVFRLRSTPRSLPGHDWSLGERASKVIKVRRKALPVQRVSWADVCAFGGYHGETSPRGRRSRLSLKGIPPATERSWFLKAAISLAWSIPARASVKPACHSSVGLRELRRWRAIRHLPSLAPINPCLKSNFGSKRPRCRRFKLTVTTVRCATGPTGWRSIRRPSFSSMRPVKN